LRGLVGFIGPDLAGRLTFLDRLLLGLGVALLRRRHERGIDDLAGHRHIPLLLELPVEGLHHPPQGPGLGQTVAEVANGVLVRRRGAEVEAQKPHPRQPVADHELHPRIREVVLRLKDQRLEHRHGVKRRTAALRSVTIAQTFDQPAAKVLEIHRRLEHLQRVTVLAQTLKMVRKPEQARLPHRRPSRSV